MIDAGIPAIPTAALGFAHGYDGAEVLHHHLWVVHQDGTETCLLERDATEEQSGYLCQEVQRVLNVGGDAGAGQGAVN